MRKTNNRIFLLGLTLLSSTCLPLSVISADKEVPRRIITLQKTGTRVKPFRPKAPDRQVVTCTYDGEELHLSFVYTEGSAILSVTDETLFTTTYEVDTTPLNVTVTAGQIPGPYIYRSQHRVRKHLHRKSVIASISI